MYDKYDSPHGEDEQLYEEDAMGRASEIGGSIIGTLKEKWPIAIALLVGIGIIWAGYDTFIGSVQKVSFDITDTEGKTVDAQIKVTNEAGEEVKTVQSRETLGLKKGDYKIDVQANGFRSIRGKSIAVSSAGPITEKLEINRNLELRGNLPTSFATGETKEIELVLVNKDAQETEVNLLLDGDAKGAMELEYEKPLIAAPGENQVKATLKVGADLSGKQIGANKQGGIRIEGLENADAKVGGKYSLIEFDSDKLKFSIGSSRSKLDLGTIKTGESTDKPIKLENDTKLDIRGVKVEVAITSAEFTPKEEAEKWFTFSPENVFNVGPESESEGTLIINIPANTPFPNGTRTESIIGAIYARTGFFEKKVDLLLEVQQVKSSIRVSGLSEAYDMKASAGVYPARTDFIDVRNDGETLLTDFDARVSCNSIGTSWLSLEGASLEYHFDSLEQGAVQKIPYTIQVPEGTGPGEIVNCKLGVLYKDPSGQRKSEEKPVIITTS